MEIMSFKVVGKEGTVMQYIQKWEMSFRYWKHRQGRKKKLVRLEFNLFFSK